MSLRVACPRCRRHIRLGVQVNPVNPSAPSSAQVNGNIIMTDEFTFYFKVTMPTLPFRILSFIPAQRYNSLS